MKKLSNEMEIIQSGTSITVERVPIEYSDTFSKGNPYILSNSIGSNFASTTVPKVSDRTDANDLKDTVPSVCLPYFSKHEFTKSLEESKFFLMRSANMDNIIISRLQNQWATTKNNEVKLNEAFNSSPHVFLFFVVSKISNIQGMARMTSPVNNKASSFWKNVELIKLGGCFKIQWLSYVPLAFNKIINIRNSLNENQPVFLSRDCTEIDKKSGKEISLFMEIPFQEKSYSANANYRSEDLLLKQNFIDDRRSTEGDAKPIFDILYRYVPDFNSSMQRLDLETVKTVYKKLSQLTRNSKNEEDRSSRSSRREKISKNKRGKDDYPDSRKNKKHYIEYREKRKYK